MQKMHWIGIALGAAVILASVIFFREDNIFFFLIGIGVLVISLPFLASIVIETNLEKDKNEKFLEFSRNLAESVKTGTPIGKSIINMRNKNFGSLTGHVQKLANQISIGIPINRALQTFANDIGSDTIRRAVSLIREAEAAGGQIDKILDSVANSIYQIEKLKKERRAAIYNLVVQGYIIFFIFIGIMLIMQFKILPLTSDVSGIGTVGSFDVTAPPTADAGGGAGPTPEQMARPFLFLLLVQGIFTGFTIGKLAEGTIKAGIKHSFILSVSAFLVSSGARVFLG
jgi:archaeal flagellar protein FlaJ